MAAIIRQHIQNEFPGEVNVIAEPGRFFARYAYTLVTRIIARRQTDCLSGSNALYQSDGVYGNFMNVLLENEVMQPTLLPAVDLAHCTKLPRRLAEHRYAIWGPTCDGTDRVSPGVTFQSEVHVGDWLKYKDMGGKF